MHSDDRSHLPPLPPNRVRIIHAASLAVLSLGLLLSWQAGLLSRQRALAEQQSQVQTQLSDFRAHLETRIYSSLALARGLSANLVLREQLAPEEFERIAEELRMSDPYMLGLSLAPGFRVTEVYPVRGNETLRGTDLMGSASLKPALLNAVQLDNAVLAGPGFGPRGKRALACLLPVWVTREGVPRLWGAIMLSLDFDALVEDAGLPTLENDLQVAIRGRDAMGPAGATFLGDEEKIGFHAVRMPVFVPGGSWLISGMPREGWQVPAWWRTQAGLIGLSLSLLSAFAVHRILRDRLRIRTLAGVDPLTSLPNRRVALAQLQRLISRGRGSDRQFALLSIDLDGFKPINDTYGHAVGDLVLSAIGQRLRKAVRGSDLIARMGGDEFLLLLQDDDAGSDEHLRQYAERIRGVLLDPIHVGDLELRLGASIGVASYPRHGGDAAALLREADDAMYRAKRGRSGGVELAGLAALVRPAGA